MFAFAQNVSIELFFGKKLINWNLIRFRSLIKPEMTIIVIIITIKSSGTSVNKNFYEKKKIILQSFFCGIQDGFPDRFIFVAFNI